MPLRCSALPMLGRRSLVWHLALVAVLVVAASCEEGPAPVGSGGGATTSGSGFALIGPGGAPNCSEPPGGAPPAPCDPLHPRVSFSADVAPLLGGCAGEVCHDAVERSALVGVPSSQCAGELLVAPGHPESSYLIRKLKGERLCCGDPMPPDAPPLADRDLEAIVAWICQNAPE